MKKLFLFFITSICIVQIPFISLTGQGGNAYQTFSEGFKNPPASARPNVYHWWLGGNVDTIRLKEELVSLKNSGIAGLTIFEIGSNDTLLVKSGPAFLGAESLAV